MTCIPMDCRLQRTWLNEFYLCVPTTYSDSDSPAVEGKEECREEGSDTSGETQSQVSKPTSSTCAFFKVAAIDPGEYIFASVYGTDNCAYHIGKNDKGRLMRYNEYIAGLQSLISKASTKKRLKYFLKRKQKRLGKKCISIVDELHKLVCKVLVTHYDLILLPTYETWSMVKKSKRDIGKSTVRSMLSWRHYQFKQRLKHMCRKHTRKLAITNEAWTSKTCSWCGAINYELKLKHKSYVCSSCGSRLDRDMNGGKCILLKAQDAVALAIEPASGPIPCNPVMDW